MKHIYLFLLVCFTFSLSQAQIVNIPNVQFKSELVNGAPASFDTNTYVTRSVDLNGDGEIQYSEAEAVYSLELCCFYPNADFTGIEAFINIQELEISNQRMDQSGFITSYFPELRKLEIEIAYLTSLDLSNNPLLTYLDINGNNLTNLDLSNNLNLTHINIDNNEIVNLDVSQQVNLTQLRCHYNELNNLNLSNNVALELLYCGQNNLTSLNLENNYNLNNINCAGNMLTGLNLDNCSNLETLICSGNQLTTIDVSNNINLDYLNCSYNSLTEIDLFNNYNLADLTIRDNFLTSLDLSQTNVNSLMANNNLLITMILKSRYDLGLSVNFEDNPNIEYICASDNQNYSVQFMLDYYGYANCVLNSYCSFVPGGDYSFVEGENKVDLDNNGCDVTDLSYPNLKFNATNINGDLTGVYISNNSGQYAIPLQEGLHTITSIFENSDYFSISPTSLVVDFPSDASPYMQDFCITPNGEIDDLEIVIIPLEVARPGFDTDYKIIYKNKGTTTLSGTLELVYNENTDLIDFVSATPNIDSDIANVLTWSYTDLQPFEIREILVTFNLNTPTETPPLNGGDPLGLVANIYPLTTDETPLDNNFQLKQIVVNSYDPNDKTCLQGETITPEQVGKYVHYMIRFENTGTASAVNVVIKDEIDLRKFDVSTLIPLHASHDFVTNIKDDNIVEFIFEDIYLPFEDATNDGYVFFKIKTLETLVLGDSFANDAEIYFDYNAPIITNNEETTIGENLSVEETSIQNIVALYPNPINNVLNIKSKNTLETVSIYDVNGRQLQSISFTGNKLDTEINTSALSQGIYFVKIKTQVGMQTTKIIKN